MQLLRTCFLTALLATAAPTLAVVGQTRSAMEPAVKPAPAGLILSPGQEAVITALFKVPGLPEPMSIGIDAGEIRATWGDGRILHIRHPSAATPLAAGATRLLTTEALTVIQAGTGWAATDVPPIAAHIRASKAPVWSRPSARVRQPPAAGRPQADLRRVDDLLRQAKEAIGIHERDKALRMLTQIQSLKLSDPERLARLGSLQARAGDTEAGRRTLADAIAVLAQRAKERPALKPAWVAALALSDVPAAVNAAKQAIAHSDAATACTWAAVAHALQQDGALPGANDVARAVLAKDKTCERAWVVNALSVDQQLAAWRGSLNVANAGLAVLPDSLPLLNVKAGALHAGFRNREAAEIWEQIARRDLQFPGVMGMLATAWTQLPTVLDDNFLDPFYAKLKADPNDVVSRYIIGTASYYRDDYPSVIAYLDPLRAVVPREPRVHLYTAMAHFHLGHKELARQRLETLQQFGHNDPDYYYCRSVMRRHTDFEGSLRDLETFVRLSQGRQNSPSKIFKMHRELEVMRSGRLPNAFDLLPDWLRWALIAAALLLVAGVGVVVVRWRRRQA